jgi:type II secretory pathway pseudopilin PulG
MERQLHFRQPNRARRKSAGRLGFTLIEILAYLPLFVGLMSVTAQLIYRTSQQQRHVIDETEIRANIDRMAGDLRSDVRDAIEMVVDVATPTRLIITAPQSLRVVYEQDGNRVVRKVLTENGMTPLQLETYDFRREQVQVSWTIDQPVVTLRVQRQLELSAFPGPVVTINATMRSQSSNSKPSSESEDAESDNLSSEEVK